MNTVYPVIAVVVEKVQFIFTVPSPVYPLKSVGGAGAVPRTHCSTTLPCCSTAKTDDARAAREMGESPSKRVEVTTGGLCAVVRAEMLLLPLFAT
jgi:hypothetical protein